MKNYSFYQLLDRELPRAIDGASRQLTDANQYSLSGNQGPVSGKAYGEKPGDRFGQQARFGGWLLAPEGGKGRDRIGDYKPLV